MRSLVVVAGVAVLLGMAGSARAQAADSAPAGDQASEEPALSDRSELARVVNLYEGGKYTECAAEFAQLLDPKSARPLREAPVIERARVYHAACLIGSGKPDLADAPLEAALRANLQMEAPDSLVFPPPVVQRFLKVRDSLMVVIRKDADDRIKRARALAEAEDRKKKAEQARVRALEELAAEETITVRNRRWIGLVPFGVGQFQNRDTALGWVFFATESLLAGTALTSLAVRTSIQAELGQVPQADEVDVNARLQGWQTALEYSSFGLLGVAALGVLEAQLAFEPEFVETRKRELPRHLRPPRAAARVAPEAAVTPDGFSLGVRGSF